MIPARVIEREPSAELAPDQKDSDSLPPYDLLDPILQAFIEKDESGDGKPDVFETYKPSSGKAVLAKREEDKNGDGAIDVTSIYENGKLVRREIADPNMVPL